MIVNWTEMDSASAVLMLISRSNDDDDADDSTKHNLTRAYSKKS